MNMQDCTQLMHSLTLHGMAEAAESLCNPNDDVSGEALHTIKFLLESELYHREQNRLSKAVKNANLPYKRAQYTDICYRGLRHLNEQAIKAVLRGDWHKQKHCVIFEGEERCGKTYVASAILAEAIRAEQKVMCTTFCDVLDELALTTVSTSIKELHQTYKEHDIIFIDDWGKRELTELIAPLLISLIGGLLGTVSLVIAGRDNLLSILDDLPKKKSLEKTLQRLFNRSHDIHLFPPTASLARKSQQLAETKNER